jgi:hypothetical protein
MKSLGHGMYKKLHELKKNIRKNMKIPRKKENPKQPVIVLRITRLLA